MGMRSDQFWASGIGLNGCVHLLMMSIHSRLGWISKLLITKIATLGVYRQREQNT